VYFEIIHDINSLAYWDYWVALAELIGVIIAIIKHARLRYDVITISWVSCTNNTISCRLRGGFDV